MLHGAPTRPEHLDPLAARLAKRWRTLLVHLPGYGKSAPLEPYAMEKSHDLLAEALAANDAREASLVGFSGGVYRACALALRGAVRPRAIVSLGGGIGFAEDEKKGLLEYCGMLRAGVDAAPILEQIFLSPRGRQEPEAVRDVRSWATATTPERLAQELEAFVAAPDLEPRLAEIDAPILVRVGALDSALPRAKRMAAASPRARLEVVPGASHALLCEDFEGTASSIERFLNEA